MEGWIKGWQATSNASLFSLCALCGSLFLTVSSSNKLRLCLLFCNRGLKFLLLCKTIIFAIKMHNVSFDSGDNVDI